MRTEDRAMYILGEHSVTQAQGGRGQRAMSSSPSWATRPVLQGDCFQTATPPTPANKAAEHLYAQWIQNNRFSGAELLTLD